MGRIKIKTMVGGLITIFLLFTFSLTHADTITVRRPNGGEAWYIGETYHIQWTSSGITGKVNIYLVERGLGTSKEIIKNAFNTGIYHWTIPNDIAPGYRYLIHIQTLDGTVGDVSDEVFTIRSKEISQPSGATIAKASPPATATITLGNQTHLTGSVSNEGDTGSFLQVGNCGMSLTARGFMSFGLVKNQIVLELMRKGYRCTDFEIRMATLEIEEYQILAFVPGELYPGLKAWRNFHLLDSKGNLIEPRSCSGADLSGMHAKISHILLDYLVGYDTFSASIYNAPMVTNIRTFQSACGVRSFPNIDAYVRYQLERGQNKIQFRLRFAKETVEGDPAWTYVYSVFFRNPKFILTVAPK